MGLQLVDQLDMDTVIMDMDRENIKCVMRNIRHKLTRFLLSPLLLRSPALLPILNPSKFVLPRLLRSLRSNVRTRLREDVSMLPSLRMPPTLLTRLRPSLESPSVTRSLSHSQPRPAPRLTMPQLHTMVKMSFIASHTI